MDINIKKSGWNDALFYVTLKSDHVTIEEDCSVKELENLARDLIEDGVFANLWSSEYVGKLVEMGIISHEQVMEYSEESKCED